MRIETNNIWVRINHLSPDELIIGKRVAKKVLGKDPDGNGFVAYRYQDDTFASAEQVEKALKDDERELDRINRYRTPIKASF